jgi:putative addiction module component (TIGR02574 family)
MTNFQDIFTAASQLPLNDRLRLIDALASSVADDCPPMLSDAWLNEIERRSAEIDSGDVMTKPWSEVRARMFDKLKG